MRDYTKLRAFILSDDLVREVYTLTKRFPKEEIFGLTSQIRRSVIAVPSNIVEGSYRDSQKEYNRFLEIAFSSLKEAHYQIGLAVKLNFLTKKELDLCESKFIETEKVLAGLIRKLKTL
ncbi:MAG: four helix bundle protein [Saprospiraceae bacterium]|nr:four helix bundle protein [Saprospiraceae bacterium]MBK7737685.1 four helix bundle protein [Saprospiraceae bacterium]MBK7913731.1 four helix bundle protein [Saprospiraceae bacterium]